MRKVMIAILMLLIPSVACASPDAPVRPARNADEVAYASAHFLRLVEAGGDPLSDLVLVQIARRLAEWDEDTSRRRHIQYAGERLEQRAVTTLGDPNAMALVLLEDRSVERDVAERISYLRGLEAASADNAFFAIVLLGLPEYRNAPAAAAGLIHRASQAARYRTLNVRAMQSIYARVQALAGTDNVAMPRQYAGMSPETYAFVQGVIYAAAIPLPAYQPLIKICGEQVVDQLRADCRHLTKLMAADADSMIDVVIAYAVLEKVADNEEERAEAVARRRQLRWLMEQSGALASEFFPDGDEPITAEQDAMAQRYARSWITVGEVAAARELLKRAGVSLEPPAEWQYEVPVAAANSAPVR